MATKQTEYQVKWINLELAVVLIFKHISEYTIFVYIIAFYYSVLCNLCHLFFHKSCSILSYCDISESVVFYHITLYHIVLHCIVLCCVMFYVLLFSGFQNRITTLISTRSIDNRMRDDCYSVYLNI